MAHIEPQAIADGDPMLLEVGHRRHCPAPIATLAPERVIYLTGTAKCLAPGLRLGWIAAPAQLAGALSNAVSAMILAAPALSSEILQDWMDDGTAARLLERPAQ